MSSKEKPPKEPQVSACVFVDGDPNLLPTERKVFKTGSVGWWGGGRVVIGGKSHQVSCSVVEVGSKPKKEKKKK